MRQTATVAGLLVAALALGGQARSATIEGWEGMRVIHQEGNPDRLIAADLDGSGRQQIVVVNARQSRLDLYRWLPKKDRTPPPAADRDRPNELPMAPEWSHAELPLEDIPVDVVAQDLDGDGRRELLVLCLPGTKLVQYRAGADGKWTKEVQWSLLAGSIAGRGHALLVRTLAGGKREALVSFEQGIQVVPLEQGSRPAWLSPRESRGRIDWKLADLDGDGDLDLMEWSQQPRQTVRWFECMDGKLLPAQVLFDQAVQGVGALMRRDKAAEILLLGGAQAGLLRRYQLTRGEETEVGRQEALAMPGGEKATWCGIQLDHRKAIVAVDPSQPRLRVHELADSGWLAEQSYPTLSNIRELAAPVGDPGLLLLLAKDAADLMESRWEAGRLTYPRAMAQATDVSDRRILALRTTGTTTWWVQRVGEDLDLYVWPAEQKAAQRHRFQAVGAKVEKAVWLGETRLLVQQAYSNAAKLLWLADGMVSTREPAHLGKVDLGEFGLYSLGRELRPARLTDGVLQWLGDDLQPVDQIMLSEGQKLGSFVPLAGGGAWALEQGGAFLHRLKPDDAGILRISASLKPPLGQLLRMDPVLGLVLVDQDRIVRLSHGAPWELKLIDSLDSRVGRPSGVKEATIHRFGTADVTGNGEDEVILADDRRHQLTVLGRSDTGLESLASWQVFEDQAYPYGDRSESLVSEPRAVVALDADGDRHQDLAMLCHDRLIIYVGREEK